eukprot:TRINITY_DN9313_c0_g2_i1.p2 TRINITY_DN9313_c0_g2~~TRINITY_DN9313_c0_g2_i1.p2  ORF type:complete len:215 (+),score=88.76 TRINITY_DN9313_c0_g2_i1:86-646(+)
MGRMDAIESLQHKKHYHRPEENRGLDGSALRVGIVSTRWNDEVISRLLQGCHAELRRLGVRHIVEFKVPGSYELPWGARRLVDMQKGEIDAIVCLGCLVKGGTMHFEYICEAVTNGIMRVNLDTGVPTLFGVLTVLNEQQARERAGLDGGFNHGTEWAQTAVEMGMLRQLKGPLPNTAAAGGGAKL